MSLPRFPLYIPSKSRWQNDRRLTSKALETMGVPYRMVVEESQYEDYARVINPAKLLILDPGYQKKYDPCCALRQDESRGSGPARNFIWDHSINEGHSHHWIMDDNISVFARYNRNLKVPVSDGTIFTAMEDFCLRYKNLAMAGPNYWMFVSRKSQHPPLTMNTRIYSCNLIRNDVPFRWKGRYNEDTILSLDMLKAGWCTVLFNAFLQLKNTTQSVAGGNTDEIYAKGTLAKSEMLVRLHPDLCRLSKRFSRIHHHADYSGFTQRLAPRDPDAVYQGVDNYGMEIVKA